MDKNKLSKILTEVGSMLEISGGNVVRAHAYMAAARTLAIMEDDLDDLIEYDILDKTPGIDTVAAEAILTLHKTGKLELYETLRTSIPSGVLEMLKLPGLGPKRVKAIWDELGIVTIRALQVACEDGRVSSLRGFGRKTCDNILLDIRNRPGKNAGKKTRKKA
ncbi:MAG: hypothetical protein LBV54_08590 [Puniceicoccales bacterium]|jgi:DNA polymerase (family 10)|nr:hypothetical protein [Puniceicoccales bacterium]